MRYELRDYQRDAALEVLKRVRRGNRDWRELGERRFSKAPLKLVAEKLTLVG